MLETLPAMSTLIAALLLERGWTVIGAHSGTALAAVGYYALVPTVLGFVL